jgi:predicted anti-sigma-YlaC factor YlaD
MHPTDDLACNELVELVTDYLENGLTPLERARLEAHLDDCVGCREYLQQMRQTITVVGHIGADSIEPEMRDRLLRVFRDWRRTG